MTNKTLFSLCFILGATSSTLAASPALICKDDGKEVFRLVPTRKRAVFLGYELGERASKEPVRFRLVGKAKLEDQYGAMKGADPVGLFTAQAENGYATFSLSGHRNDVGYPAEYDNASGSGSCTCEPGPSFARLKKVFAKAPTLTKERYRQLSDKGLAALCRKDGEANASYEMRAFRHGFGDVSLQLNQLAQEFGAREDYSALTFGKNDALIFRNSDRIQIQYEEEKLSRLYLDTKASKTKGGAKVHSVTVVPDLKDPSQPMYELFCTEEHAFPVIGTFAKEALQMPKAFPKTPGTLAQLDRSLCDPEKYEEATDRMSKWTRLIMNFEVPKGSDITSISHGRTKDKCLSFEIGISDQAGADALRKVLGETLDGIRVDFDIGDGGGGIIAL
jgi:hypothetical protein